MEERLVKPALRLGAVGVADRPGAGRDRRRVGPGDAVVGRLHHHSGLEVRRAGVAVDGDEQRPVAGFDDRPGAGVPRSCPSGR